VELTEAGRAFGLERMRDGFPLSPRLIREIHEVLLAKGARQPCTAGAVQKKSELDRRQPARRRGLCTASAQYVVDFMGKLETFIHQEGTSLPLLIKAGLVHAQFESILGCDLLCCTYHDATIDCLTTASISPSKFPYDLPALALGLNKTPILHAAPFCTGLWTGSAGQ